MGELQMLGETLKELRKEKRVTQEELASIIGVERSSIGKYESSKKPIIPSIDVAIKMSDYFNVSLDYLLGKTNPKKVDPPESESTKKSIKIRQLEKLVAQLSDDEFSRLLGYATCLADEKKVKDSRNL